MLPPSPDFNVTIAVLAALWLVYEHRDGFAFAATTVTMASAIVAIFTGLYPNVMVSSTTAANNLTAHNTASLAYPPAGLIRSSCAPHSYFGPGSLKWVRVAQGHDSGSRRSLPDGQRCLLPGGGAGDHR